jgi:ADP-heptose:LPS heptosyltransferase
MAQTRTLPPGKLRRIAALDTVVRPLMQLAPRPLPLSQDARPERILVVELWGLGDVVLATPFLAELRERFPNASVTLLARSPAESLLSESGLVDDVVAFDFPWTSQTRKYAPSRYEARALRRLFAGLRARRFDLCFDARRDIRSNVVTYLAGAARRVGYDFGGGAYLLTDTVPSGDQQAHRSDDWLELLLPVLGERPRARPPMLRVTPAEVAAARNVLRALQLASDRPVVAIDPGASNRIRRLRPELVQGIAGRLITSGMASVILMLSPELADDEFPVPAGAKVVRPSLRELMALIAAVDLLVCSDSAPMHIAAALGTPTTATFGPQPRQWFAPRGSIHRAVQIEPMPCRPCFDACIYASPLCMDSISVDSVFRAVASQLQGLASSRGDATVAGPAGAAP